MDKHNLPNMKTGFNLVVDEKKPDEQFLKDITTILATYMDGALRNAALYVSHGPRKICTREDIKRALMLEIFFFDKRPDLLEKAQKMREELFPEDGEDEESESEDESSEENNILVNDEHVPPFVLNSCACAFCTCVNTVYERWGKWEPVAPLKILLKKHIELM